MKSEWDDSVLYRFERIKSPKETTLALRSEEREAEEGETRPSQVGGEGIEPRRSVSVEDSVSLPSKKKGW